ncbi:hypothetical protein [Microbacterium sp. MPKO10]|uniref:hypothetical protein n=1 Tax=Microbacterium sp. MPKO10 TaxID=2989818 RepID=UPI002235B416|nr:hypothetical protein [Microbacterium sp. MPKO10]MCW4458196.1 hypothetical protein [Microbacterium sp. MPKO10]
MSRIKRLWLSIREPRKIKAIYFVYYAIAAGTGLATLLWPPRSIEGALGAFLTTLWAAFILGGGIASCVAVFPGRWWLERAGIYAILGGILIYEGTVMFLQFTETGNRLTQFGVLLLATGLFIVRLIPISRYSFEPRPSWG